MSNLETGKNYPTLSEFDAMWRASGGRDFYAIICETLGEDVTAYEDITQEMIEETARRKESTSEQVKSQTARDILRSLQFVINDPELSKDEKRMAAANKGMNTWLQLLKENYNWQG